MSWKQKCLLLYLLITVVYLLASSVFHQHKKVTYHFDSSDEDVLTSESLKNRRNGLAAGAGNGHDAQRVANFEYESEDSYDTSQEWRNYDLAAATGDIIKEELPPGNKYSLTAKNPSLRVTPLYWARANGTVERNSHNFISAYYDDRRVENAGRPAVVVIGYAHPMLQSDLYCYFEYSDGRGTCLKKRAIQENVDCGRTNLIPILKPYNYICTVDYYDSDKEPPAYVAISSFSDCRQHPRFKSALIPVTDNSRNREKPLKKFGVCLQGPLRQDMDADPTGEVILQNITDFIRMSLLLGAEQITMYASPLDLRDSITRRLLETYHSNLLEIVEWKKFPRTHYPLHYHGQLVLINDCLYRNMYRVEYLVMMDLDEMIIPVVDNSWLEMMAYLVQEETAMGGGRRPSISYKFLNTFLMPASPPSSLDTLPKSRDMELLGFCKGRTPNYFTRNSELLCNSTHAMRTKMVLHPERVISTSIHEVCETLPGYPQVFNVPSHMGINAHYREGVPEYMGICDDAPTRVNNVVMKFAGYYSRKFCL